MESKDSYPTLNLHELERFLTNLEPSYNRRVRPNSESSFVNLDNKNLRDRLLCLLPSFEGGGGGRFYIFYFFYLMLKKNKKGNKKADL
jgi:hypothetical protein